MTFEQKAMLYYHYCLELEIDGFDGVPFTPTEFFKNLEEDLELDTPEFINEAFKWGLNG